MSVVVVAAANANVVDIADNAMLWMPMIRSRIGRAGVRWKAQEEHYPTQIRGCKRLLR